MSSKASTKTKSNDEVIFNFFPFQWQYDTSTIDEAETIHQTMIYVYGWNEKNETVAIKIPDFQIPMWLELPFTPTERQEDKLFEWINSCCREHEKPTSISKVDRIGLYYADVEMTERNSSSDPIYRHRRKPYLQIMFRTQEHIDNFVREVKKNNNYNKNISGLGKIKLLPHCFEKSITPILKLLAVKQLPSSSWIKCKGQLVKDDDKATSKTYEYNVSWKNLKSHPDADKMPIVHPKILSFDNEAYSHDHNRMPQANEPADCVFMIGCTIQWVENKEKKRSKYLLVLGDIEPYIDERDNCPVEILRFESEAKLYVGFAKFIREHDPDVVIGYNIFGFDIKYMSDRAILLSCIKELSRLGCFPKKVCPLTRSEWSSSAYGKQDLLYWEADGRLFIDLYPYIVRNYKLSNYKLDTVCHEFLPAGMSKDPIKAKDMFKIFESQDKAGMLDVGKYCVQDSYVTLLIFEKLLVWFDLVEAATTCCVPMIYLYTKGQQIKIYSQMLKYCFKNDIIIQSGAYEVKDDEDYVGATVTKPKAGLYKMILPFDFASLYPSIMMAHNIDYSKLVVDKPVVNPNVKDEDCWIFDWTEHYGCLALNSLVNLEHYSVKISSLQNEMHKVLSYNENKKGIDFSLQDYYYDQGVQDCLRLHLVDGNTIDCTYDHKFLNENNVWIEAKDIEVGKTKLIGSLDLLEVDFENDLKECNNWSLQLNGLLLKTSDLTEIKRTMAFMRLLGYVLTDGHIPFKKQNHCTLYIGHKIDIEIVKNDIELICGSRPASRRGENTYNIVLPAIIKHSILSIEGIVKGKRTEQNSSWPTFVLKQDFPKCLLREFLGGLFGGDGSCPSLNTKANTLGNLNFVQSRNKEYISSFDIFTKEFQNMLLRFDIESRISDAVKGKNITRSIFIDNNNILDFHNKIGMRYCYHKIHRLSAAASYYKLRRKIQLQRDDILNLTKQIYESQKISIKEAWEFAKIEYSKNNFILNEHYSLGNYDWIHDKISKQKDSPKRYHFTKPYFYSITEFLEETNSLAFFNDKYQLKNKYGHAKPVYSVNFDSDVFPFLYKKVVHIEKIGKIPVCDISVKNTHNFIVNGVVTHNCEHDPIKRKKTKDGKVKRICDSFRFRFLKADKEIETTVDGVVKKVKVPVSGKGVMPTLLENLISARKSTRKIIAQNEEEIKRLKLEGNYERANELNEINQVLDKRQLSYKVSANSMYGAMGVKKGYLPFLPGAMVVTYTGRESIKKASRFLEDECGGQVIYNDTDSAYTYFESLNNKTAAEIWSFAADVVKRVAKLFPPPMKLEFEEKVYAKFLILTKKRYVGIMMDENGKMGKLAIRGVVLTRRDNCRLLRDLYQKGIMYILDNVDDLVKLNVNFTREQILKNRAADGLINLMTDGIEELFNRSPEYTYKDFVITKGLTKDAYKGKTIPVHAAVAQRMRARGIYVPQGARIEYLLLDRGKPFDKNEKQNDKAEDVNFFVDNRSELRIDYLFYFLKQIVKPLEEIVSKTIFIEGLIKDHFQQRLNKNKLIHAIKKVWRPKITVLDEGNWKTSSLYDFTYNEGGMPTGWKEFFENDEVKNEIKTISKWLEQTEKRTIFPALSDVWKALVWTPAKDCRVVILGQDPYHTLMGCEEGVTDTIPACGIAFMVKSGHQINPSLQNIFKELKSCGFNVNSKKGDLTRWCRSGILLLNTALTVAEGQPESHLGKWKNFTNMLLDYIGKKSLGLLWGKPSIAFKDKFKSTVCTTHPSPLAAYKSTATVGSFIGSLCFNKVNEELRKLDMEEVDWNLSE